jgi:hypothetical protein
LEEGRFRGRAESREAEARRRHRQVPEAERQLAPAPDAASGRIEGSAQATARAEGEQVKKPASAFGLFDYTMLPKINRLLKAYGLRLKQRSNRASWGDQMEITVEQAQNTPTVNALEVIHRYGGIDGGHHKQWVLDQVVRALTGDRYAAWVANQKAGDDGPNTYEWDEGIAP